MHDVVHADPDEGLVSGVRQRERVGNLLPRGRHIGRGRGLHQPERRLGRVMELSQGHSWLVRGTCVIANPVYREMLHRALTPAASVPHG